MTKSSKHQWGYINDEYKKEVWVSSFIVNFISVSEVTHLDIALLALYFLW